MSEQTETVETKEKINHILICLGVLGAVQENDLLTWDTDGNPNIQYRGPFRPIRRYYTGQSRSNNIVQLNTVIYDAINIFHEDETNSNRIKQALLNSTHGLKNLMKTYSADQHNVQALNVLHEDIINLESEITYTDSH